MRIFLGNKLYYSKKVLFFSCFVYFFLFFFSIVFFTILFPVSNCIGRNLNNYYECKKGKRKKKKRYIPAVGQMHDTSLCF